MVGANYMGGKRNTVRAKSKDIVGRAQRRHFGKQRLASALRVTQENRVHASASALSFLPEITFAHARRDPCTDSDTTSPSNVFSRDQLFSSSTSSSTTWRNKSPKVLSVLDTSDHVSMRAAIDRILQQPDLVGITIPNLGEATPSERMPTPMEVRRSSQALPAPKGPDAQPLEIASKRAFDPPVACLEISRHEHMGLHEPNPSQRYSLTESGIHSLPDSPLRVTSWDTVDSSGCVKTPSLTGVSSSFRTEGNGPERSNTFPGPTYILPPPSPFPSSPQSGSDLIADPDTSPLGAIRFERLARQSSQSFSIRDGSAGVDEAQSVISSFTNSDQEGSEAERSYTARFNNNLAFPSTAYNDFGPSPPSEYGRDTIRVVTSQQVAEDDVLNGISIDFLSDPHPWETIGRILKLEPSGPSAAQSIVGFTMDREGVGYVLPESSNARNARSSDVISLETRMDGGSTSDIHVISSTGPPILEIVDLDMPNADNGMAIYARQLACTTDSSRSLIDTGSPPTTQGEDDPFTPVHAAQVALYIPVVHCNRNEHAPSSSPFTIIVETTTNPDVDVMFAGPCLFGDSDLEEDE